MAGEKDKAMPEEAQRAWRAYREMGLSKSVYFEFLQRLDEIYKEGGSPAIAETLELEKLLKIHDEKVMAFNEAMQAINDREIQGSYC